jgi:Flp pilus assembly protein TadD
MRIGISRVLVVALSGLWLGGCNTTDSFSNSFATNTPGADANASVPPEAETTGSVAPPRAMASAEPGLPGGDPNNDLSLGKKHYRANNFGVAEKHFRRAVELHPRDAESWLGLAACYDRLRRFDLADRAYSQAIGIVGLTVEIMNNQGYSYMLRGDLKRAHEMLTAAQRKDPGNRFVQNNLQLLDESSRKGKVTQ